MTRYHPQQTKFCTADAVQATETRSPLLDNFFLILLYLGIGVLARRIPKFTDDTPVVLNAFVLYIALPALILQKITALTFSTALLIPAVVPWILLLIVVATVQVANSIALEATLSFLGLGMPVSEPSLGMLIANGFQYMLSGRYWISIYPGIALIVLIVAINLVGDQIRDQLNPRLKR